MNWVPFFCDDIGYISILSYLHINEQFSMTEMSCDRGEMETLYYKTLDNCLLLCISRESLVSFFPFSLVILT